MKFILCCRTTINFSEWLNGAISFSIDVDPERIRSSDETSQVEQVCDSLRQLLLSPHNQEDSTSSNQLAFECRQAEDGDTVSLRVMKGPVTESLVELFGYNFAVQLSFVNLRISEPEMRIREVNSSEMKYIKFMNYICIDESFCKSGDPAWKIMQGGNLNGNLTVTLIGDE